MKFKKNTRFFVIYFFVIVFFVISVLRLFFLQISENKESEATIKRMLSLTTRDPAPRGKICDRNETVLAGNRRGYIITIKKGEDLPLATTVKNLSLICDISYDELLYNMQTQGFSYNNPFVLSEDADFELVTKIKESPEKYPCAQILTQPVREYFFPETAVHLLGRCGIISKEEHESLNGYNRDDYIGKQGAERAFENILRGTHGTRAKEKYVDSTTKTFCDDVAPIPGKDVILTIDLPLQQQTEKALSDAVSNNSGAVGGAVVVIDVNSGEVLAMASNPTYNITEFSKNYSKLSTDKNKPIFNRSLSGLYEPGSTFKPVTAIAALESGTLAPDETIKTLGKYEYFDQIFRCNIYREKGKIHGTIDVQDALSVSCNYFFYELGNRTGIDEISQYAFLFGLNSATGIELTQEEAIGTVASFKERSAKGEKWYAGDTLQAAIGQSDNRFTPIALANYSAALANGGTIYRCHVLKGVKDQEKTIYTKPEILNTIDISEKTMQTIKEGMIKVTTQGTAKDVFSKFPVLVAGKTGTAQVSGRTNGLFIGYAPADNPEISFCVVVEGGKSGNLAANVAKSILSHYFNAQ